MAPDPAQGLKSRMRGDLAGAMRGTPAVDIAVLRTAIGASDNAQALFVGDRHDQ